MKINNFYDRRFYEPVIGMSPMKLMPPPPARAAPRFPPILEREEQVEEEEAPVPTAPAPRQMSLEDALRDSVKSLQCSYCKRTYKDKKYVKKHFNSQACPGIIARKNASRCVSSLSIGMFAYVLPRSALCIPRFLLCLSICALSPRSQDLRTYQFPVYFMLVIMRKRKP